MTSRIESEPGPAKAADYDALAKSLHWLVVLLLACQYATAFLLPDIRMDTPPDTTINLHFNLGLLIAVVMAARWVHRVRRPVAVAPGDSPVWERALARATHLAFYAVLLTGPFLGWAAASAHGVPVRLLGVATLPELARRKAGWGLLAGDIHGLGMWVMLGLVALHAAAALYHRYVRHDGVLRRMLPEAPRPSRSPTTR